LKRRGGKMEDHPLADNNIWVTIQLNDDLEQIYKYAGDDRFVIGTNYGHADSATEIYALRTFQKDERMKPESRTRILWGNAIELYSIR
jgi:predicted TIM-barrel fold metal-dependent hydrolase